MYRPLAILATALLALSALGLRPAHADDVPQIVITDQKVGTGAQAREEIGRAHV